MIHTHPNPVTLLKLLGHELRWQLVQYLVRGDYRVQDLVPLLKAAPNLISYHLHQLEAATLVEERRSDADGRDVFFHLDPASQRARSTNRWNGAARSRTSGLTRTWPPFPRSGAPRAPGVALSRTGCRSSSASTSRMGGVLATICASWARCSSGARAASWAPRAVRRATPPA